MHIVTTLFSQLPVHLLKRPEKHNITPQETEVNVAARWENLEKEIVATGLCDGKHNILYMLTSALYIFLIFCNINNLITLNMNVY